MQRSVMQRSVMQRSVLPRSVLPRSVLPTKWPAELAEQWDEPVWSSVMGPLPVGGSKSSSPGWSAAQLVTE
jgi:hypothetical protein